MTQHDRDHWDERYRTTDPAAAPAFVEHAALFPTTGRALELACGRGETSVWLAERGLAVVGVDVSPVAIDNARALAAQHGVGDRCRFEVHDLDDGLPGGPPVDVLVCHLFRDTRLYRAMAERLAPGGLLAVAVLSEVGAAPGRFRAAPGELLAAFSDLQVLVHHERDGRALLLASAREPDR